MHTMREDKEHSNQEVRKLKTTLEELRSQLVELPPPQPLAELTEVEQWLEEES
jgi:hypothetical protein